MNADQVRAFRESLGLTQDELAKMIGKSVRAIQSWEQGVRNVPQSVMLTFDAITANKFSSRAADAHRITVQENSELYTNNFGNTFMPLEDGRYLMGSPIVPSYAKGGRMAGFADSEYFEELPKHYVVVDRIHRGKYLTFDMIGESMDCNSRDYIAPGARITAREIKKELWVGAKLHLNDYKDFIIEHVEGLSVKRIIAHDTNNYIITCHSLNEDKEKYPDFDLNLNDVLNLFNIIKVENPR